MPKSADATDAEISQDGRGRVTNRLNLTDSLTNRAEMGNQTSQVYQQQAYWRSRSVVIEVRKYSSTPNQMSGSAQNIVPEISEGQSVRLAAPYQQLTWKFIQEFFQSLIQN